MGTAKAVMVVVTQPKHPLAEDEYNTWYSDNHLPYVLLSEGFPSASRFRQTKVLKGAMTPYLALYQADWDDTWQAQEAYAAMGRRGIGARWNRSPGNSLQVEWWSYYTRIAETGSPSPDVDPPASILVTFAHPDGGAGNTGLFFAGQLEAWYRNFLDDMHDCPLVRGSTFYRLGLHAGGDTPPRYLSVHELNADASAGADAVHAGIVRWMQNTPQRADLASVLEPQAPVALDFWGYYDHIVTHLKKSEDELLRGRGDG